VSLVFRLPQINSCRHYEFFRADIWANCNLQNRHNVLLSQVTRKLADWYQKPPHFGVMFYNTVIPCTGRSPHLQTETVPSCVTVPICLLCSRLERILKCADIYCYRHWKVTSDTKIFWTIVHTLKTNYYTGLWTEKVPSF